MIFRNRSSDADADANHELRPHDRFHIVLPVHTQTIDWKRTATKHPTANLQSSLIEFRSDDITKNDFAEIMGFVQLFRTTYLKKVHTQKNNNCSLVH